MLKISSTNGKFDISFAEEKPFQHEVKPKDKFGNKPSKRTTSRASVNPVKYNKQLTKPLPPVHQLNGKHKSDVNKVMTKNHSRAQERVTTFSQKEKVRNSRAASSLKVESQKSVKPEVGAGYITQSKLQNLLATVSGTTADSKKLGTSLTPEQLSLLLTVLKKDEGPSNEQTVGSIPEGNKVPTKEQLSQDTVNHNVRSGPGYGQINEEGQSVDKNNSDQAHVVEKNQMTSKELTKGAEVSEEYYNPWGRPGAGAPIRSHSGNIVADYRKMHDLGSTTKFPGVSTDAAPSMQVVSTVGASTSNYSTSVPIAMRSSFAVGAPGLVSQDTKQSKAEEHRKYIQELEKQIQEKKERDRQQKLREQQEELKNKTWSQHLDQPKTSPKAQVNTVVPPVVTQAQATPVSPGLNNLRSSIKFGSVPADTSLTPSTHARGHGMHALDLQSQEEAERKRQKMLEHQRAIQEQVEEKRRIKQQEKEQKMREEAQEEARLALERESIKQQHELDQRKQREKEEEAKRRSEALQLSVLQAYQEAQQAKTEKRLKHLESGGHDVSRLRPRSNGATSRSYVIDGRGARLEPDPVVKEPPPVQPSVTPHLEKDSLSQSDTLRLSEEYNALLDKDTGPKHTSSLYDHHSSFRIENTHPQVPPLELERSNSPPVPAVRRKLRAKSPKRSSRDKRGKANRTGSSLSEPIVSQTKKSPTKSPTPLSQRNKCIKKRIRAATPTPHEIGERPEVEGKPPFSPLEDAFMVPYLRTTSATLPPPPDTPAATQSLANSKSRGKVDRLKNARHERRGESDKGENLHSVNRHRPISLKEDILHEESARKTRESQESQRINLKTKQTSKEKPGVGDLVIKAQKEHSMLREDSPEYPMPLVPSARQEMILKQLAALRQGLMIKEREYQRPEF